MSKLEEIQERRAARKAALKEKEDAQLVIDLEAIDALEQDLGDGNVETVRARYVEGLPVLVAVKTPSKTRLKVYKDRLREAKPNPTKAAEEIGLACLVYPDKETFASLDEARPGMSTEVGLAALKLATSREAAEGEGSAS